MYVENSRYAKEEEEGVGWHLQIRGLVSECLPLLQIDLLRHFQGEDGQSIRIRYKCCKYRTLFIDSVPYILFLRLSHWNMKFSSDSYRLYLIFMVTATDYI